MQRNGATQLQEKTNKSQSRAILRKGLNEVFSLTDVKRFII